MITEYQTIDYLGKPLFTWVTLTTPTEEAVDMPSEACFAYIVDGNDQAVFKQADIKAEPGKMILSLCGTTVGQMIAQQEAGKLSTVIVHFHKLHLEKIFEGSKPPLWTELESPVTEYVVQMAASVLVKQYFEGIIQLFNHQAAVTDEILALKLQEVILLLLQTENSPHLTKIIRSLFSEKTFTFKEIVESHVCLPVSINDLAHLTNHSLSSFKREFRRIYDTTPGTYLIDKRTEKVANLLTVSDDSVSRIGYQCGFASPAHLTRAFKERYGVTPSVFRSNFSVK